MKPSRKSQCRKFAHGGVRQGGPHVYEIGPCTTKAVSIASLHGEKLALAQRIDTGSQMSLHNMPRFVREESHFQASSRTVRSIFPTLGRPTLVSGVRACLGKTESVHTGSHCARQWRRTCTARHFISLRSQQQRATVLLPCLVQYSSWAGRDSQAT